MRTPEAWLQEGLLEVLAGGSPMTVEEVAAAIQPPVAEREVGTALDSLVDQELVRRVPPGAGDDLPHHYQIAGPGEPG